MKIEDAITQGNFVFVYHKDSRNAHTAIVKNFTDKAIQIQLEFNNRLVWLPKNALNYHRCGAFYIKQWFKEKLIRENKNYVFKALNVLE
tara:strand:+ start:432 stop:698 length:267 start_codon:yes stop_codon:yes gene_type:complete